MNTITRSSVQYFRPSYLRVTNYPGQATDVVVPLTIVTATDYKTSASNPKWRSQVKNHQSATTSREIVNHKMTGGYGVAEVHWLRNEVGGVTERYSEEHGRIWSASFPTIPDVSTVADNQALAKFWKRAKEAQTAFRGLTALGELRETLRMIRRPAQGLRRGLDDYLKNVTKRSRRSKKSSLPRIVSETWLEHAFGWQPLISDVKSAGEALNRRLNRFMGNYTRVSGKGEVETSSFGSLSTRTDLFLRLHNRPLTTRKVSVRYYGQVRSVCENPVQADMTLFGTNWREIVPTAWELIPYSFLADYFTNIGDILDAWSLRKSDVAWVAKSVKRHAEVTLSEAYIDPTYTPGLGGYLGDLSRSLSTSYLKASKMQINRSPQTPMLPSIQLEIPGLGTKWINMTALLGARNRTRRQLFQ